MVLLFFGFFHQRHRSGAAEGRFYDARLPAVHGAADSLGPYLCVRHRRWPSAHGDNRHNALEILPPVGTACRCQGYSGGRVAPGNSGTRDGQRRFTTILSLHPPPLYL